MKIPLLLLLFAALSATALESDRSANAPLEELNIKFMQPGHFRVASKTEDENALGGFAGSDNFPKSITSSINAPLGKLSLLALPDIEAVFNSKFKGMTVLLVNSTDAPISFSASDSRIDIVQEALTLHGEWRPIDFLPQSWCGNSYHHVALAANEYWEFAAPRFAGSLKTKLRFRFDQQISGATPNTIYSNEFDGLVNPEQFSLKRDQDR